MVILQEEVGGRGQLQRVVVVRKIPAATPAPLCCTAGEGPEQAQGVLLAASLIFLPRMTEYRRRGWRRRNLCDEAPPF